MQSKKLVESLDTFESDVPITAADSVAQWSVREHQTMTSKEYLDWCSWITRDSVSPCRDHHQEPFEL